MQNRSNRNLLFGGRGAGAAPADGDLQSESLESENQRGVERLGGSAGAMKDIAIAIEADVTDQNKALAGVDRRFESTSSVVTKTMAALNDLAIDRSATKIGKVVGGFFTVLFVAYLWLR